MNINCSATNDLFAATTKPGIHRKEKEADAAATRSVVGHPDTAADAAREEPAQSVAGGPEDMEGLMKVWGQASDQYDFDNDGAVDVDDLIALITNWQQPDAAPASESTAAVAVADAAGPADVAEPSLPVAPGSDETAAESDASVRSSTDGTAASLDANGSVESSTDSNVEPAELTDMDRLMLAWGQPSDEFDFDGDGSVDVDDMLTLMMNWQPTPPPSAGQESAPVSGSEPSSPVQPTPNDTAAPASSKGKAASLDATATDGVENPVPQTEMDRLMMAWGQPSNEFDFDGDGIVDVDDMLTLMMNWHQQPTTPQSAIASSTTALGDVHPTSGPGSKGSWDAATGSTPPSDADKPLAARDVARKPKHDRRSIDADAHIAKPLDGRPDRSLPAEALSKISASLVDRLMTSGYRNRPPTNLRDIVDSLNLSKQDARSVLRDLKQAYPDGLGLNFRA